MKLRNRLRRIAFYFFVYNESEVFADFWYDVDKKTYRKFVNFALGHELWDTGKTVNDQDASTRYLVLSDYFDKNIKNDFDAKYAIWAQ